ncbi:MAG: MBL fold metallo-hydrolase [Bacteriovoracaceae bacterium]|nr:MBL fold metallo-hydrolase [Bacteriovoracaceae bacterium]
MKISLLHPSTFKLDGGAMFGIIPKPLWERKIRPDELNRIPMSLRVVLIETKNKKILIDTGIGDYHGEKFDKQFAVIGKKSPLINALKEADIEADQITDIILTHLHFDHVGGLGHGTQEHKRLFPQARIHVHKKHYEYAKNPTKRDAGSFQTKFFLPLMEQYEKENKIHFLDSDKGEILSDEGEKIEFLTSFGHTPHMIHPVFENYIYMADLVPMSHHVNIPWVMGYDLEPGTTTVYKEKFYNYVQDKDLTMIFEHDMDVWGGKLAVDDKGRFILQQPQESKKLVVERI